MATVQILPTHASTKARPADPLLASSIIDSAALDTILANLNLPSTTASSTDNTNVLRTGVKSVDDALGPTLQSGRVIALSSEKGSQRDDLAKTLLADCLIRCVDGFVAVVDTTGNFDVVGLYAQILKRLEREPEELTRKNGGAGGDDMYLKKEDVAAKALDRVKIMRVFDFVGVREAVGELRDGLEGRAKRSDSNRVQEGRRDVKESTTPVEAVTVQHQPPSKKTEIADSEDEDENEDLEALDDDMLLDIKPPTPDPDPAPTPTSTSTPPPLPHLKLLLIDNLAHILLPLLKKDSSPTTTLATTFLTTLADLTRTHALHTLLLNPCNPTRSPSPLRKPAVADAPPAPQQQSYVSAPLPPPSPSVFSSQVAVPALLGLMARFADAHVLVGELPRRKMDARVYYADTGGRERGKRRGVEMVGVCEVVSDRWGGRVGAWGSLEGGR